MQSPVLVIVPVWDGRHPVPAVNVTVSSQAVTDVHTLHGSPTHSSELELLDDDDELELLLLELELELDELLEDEPELLLELEELD